MGIRKIIHLYFSFYYKRQQKKTYQKAPGVRDERIAPIHFILQFMAAFGK